MCFFVLDMFERFLNSTKDGIDCSKYISLAKLECIYLKCNETCSHRKMFELIFIVVLHWNKEQRYAIIN